MLQKCIGTFMFICCLFYVSTFEGHAIEKQQEILVAYKDNIGKQHIKRYASTYKEYSSLEAISGYFTQQEIQQLQKNKHIRFVEKNYETIEMNNTNDLPWNMTALNITKAWQSNLTGKGVKIAIMDSGVADHTKLLPINRISIVDDATNTDAKTPYHGTAVAGVLKGNQKMGYAGITPGATLYSVKIFDNEKKKSAITALYEGLDWAIKHDIDIINMSVGTTTNYPALKYAIERVAKKDILLVASAGNNGTKINYPANYDEVIAVGSVNASFTKSTFSNAGTKVEFVAPGEIQGLNENNGTAIKKGTSFAAPHITGVLALLKEKYPTYTSTQLREELRNYTIDLGIEGRDINYGYGLATMTLQTPLKPTLKSTLESNTTIKLKHQTPSKSVVKAQKYLIYVNDQLVTTTKNTTSTLKNLSENKKYTIKVRAQSSRNKLSNTVTQTVVTNMTQAYIQQNAKDIKQTLKHMHNKKNVAYLAKFAPIYSVSTKLTTADKKIVAAYKKKINLIEVSATKKTSLMTASNLTKMSSKKVTTLTFKTPINPASVNKNKLKVYFAGKSIAGIKVAIAKSGKTATISMPKEMQKGTYFIMIDTENIKTAKGKKVMKPIALQFKI